MIQTLDQLFQWFVRYLSDEQQSIKWIIKSLTNYYHDAYKKTIVSNKYMSIILIYLKIPI